MTFINLFRIISKWRKIFTMNTICLFIGLYNNSIAFLIASICYNFIWALHWFYLHLNVMLGLVTNVCLSILHMWSKWACWVLKNSGSSSSLTSEVIEVVATIRFPLGLTFFRPKPWVQFPLFYRFYINLLLFLCIYNTDNIERMIFSCIIF